MLSTELKLVFTQTSNILLREKYFLLQKSITLVKIRKETLVQFSKDSAAGTLLIIE